MATPSVLLSVSQTDLNPRTQPFFKDRAEPLSMRPAGLLVLTLLSLTLAGCTAPGPEDPEGVTHAPPQTAAPDFTVRTIDGENVTLSDLRGKAVLIEFMGLGCTSCRAMLPDHKQLWETYGDDPRFVFLAVNVWSVWCGDHGCGTTGESSDDMRAYRDEHGIPWDMAQAAEYTPGEYNIRGTPTHFLIDHEGNVHAALGQVSYETLAQEVEHLLALVPTDH